MPLWTFTTSGSPGLSTKTYAQAKKEVARIVGAQDKPEEAGADSAIGRAIAELNRVRWEYLTVTGSDITVVSAAGLVEPAEGANGRYTLPTPFKDYSSLLLGGQSLTYVPRASWDALTSGSPVGGTYFYTNFEQGLTGKIQLLDAPTGAGTLSIRYYRPMLVPQDDGSTLDVPANSPLEAALILKAQVYVAQERGLRSERLQLLLLQAERMMKSAMGDDLSHVEAVVQLLPMNVWGGRAVNPNSTWWVD